LFFPKGNETAALLSAFATYAAGSWCGRSARWCFGRIGDLVGRKYTSPVTIVVMGTGDLRSLACCRTYQSIGWAAPVLLSACGCCRAWLSAASTAGAATYVAEHAPKQSPRLRTSWIQTTATLGFFLRWRDRRRALLHGRQGLREWGWRLPFLVSLILLVFSIYIRLKLQESPVFPEDEGRGQGLQGAPDRQLLEIPQQQVRAAGAAGRHRRAGRGLVHRSVLRAVSS